MSKFFLSLLLSCTFLLPNITSAQEYCPFDFENGLWESRYYAAFSSNGVYRSEYNDYAVGDTLVNDSLLCYKLLRTGVQCFPDYYTFDCTPEMPFTQDLGVICEQDKRVYNNGNLLYDFNVEVGDTIFHWAGISSGSISQVPIIAEIDSVEMCGKMRKRFRTNYFALGDVYFVEGIGSSAGLIPRYEFFEDGSSLSCYSDQNCTPCPLNYCNGTVVLGSPCDDGNSNTVNDVYQADCSCAGTPPECSDTFILEFPANH